MTKNVPPPVGAASNRRAWSAPCDVWRVSHMPARGFDSFRVPSMMVGFDSQQQVGEPACIKIMVTVRHFPECSISVVGHGGRLVTGTAVFCGCVP